MTRDEAITKLYMALMRVPLGTQVNSANWCGGVVDGLVDLGVLELEATEDKDRMSAAKYLDVVLGDQRAYAVIDILTKNGFKITRVE